MEPVVAEADMAQVLERWETYTAEKFYETGDGSSWSTIYHPTVDVAGADTSLSQLGQDDMVHNSGYH